MNLQEFFVHYPKVAIAFSGGVDSAYLLYSAKQFTQEICAYYVKSEFQPQFELEDAKRLADELGVDMKILTMDVLKVSDVQKNPINRCYYCKKAIFQRIMDAAKSDGYMILLDGTNASDDVNDRPGMKALQELSVLSPLRMCGLTKEQIRNLSREAGLFTWDKPAYACLATRIPSGEEITKEKINDIEEAEGYLFSLGFTDFRIRSRDGHGKIQLPESQWEQLLENKDDIYTYLEKYFKTISLDLEVKR